MKNKSINSLKYLRKINQIIYDGFEPDLNDVHDKHGGRGHIQLAPDYISPPEKISDILVYGNDMVNDKFVFPNNIKRIRLDIGLSTSAPHSCEWLLEHNDVGIIGIEANPLCVKQLFYGTTPNSYINSLFLQRAKICKFVGYMSEVYIKKYLMNLDLSIRENQILNFSEKENAKFKLHNKIYHISSMFVSAPGISFRLFPIVQEIADINNRYQLIHAAVDNVENIIVQKLYSSYPALGCSSLVKGMIEANERPAGNTEDYPNVVGSTYNVPSFSLDTVLEHVDWSKFPFIESIKIDVEGKDLEVLKSCKKHMDKVVYFRAEAYDDENIVYGIKKQDMVEYMQANNFELIDEEDGDYGFINKKYKNLAQKQGLTYR